MSPLCVPFWAQPLDAPCGCCPLGAPLVRPHTCTRAEWMRDERHYTALSAPWLSTYWCVQQRRQPRCRVELEPIGIVWQDGKQSDDVTLIAWSRVKQAL